MLSCCLDNRRAEHASRHQANEALYRNFRQDETAHKLPPFSLITSQALLASHVRNAIISAYATLAQLAEQALRKR